MSQQRKVILFVFASLALVAGAMTLTHIGQAARVEAAAKKAESEKNIIGWVHLDPETAQLVYVEKP